MKKIAITDYTFPDLSMEEAILRPEGIEVVCESGCHAQAPRSKAEDPGV